MDHQEVVVGQLLLVVGWCRAIVVGSWLLLLIVVSVVVGSWLLLILVVEVAVVGQLLLLVVGCG